VTRGLTLPLQIKYKHLFVVVGHVVRIRLHVPFHNMITTIVSVGNDFCDGMSGSHYYLYCDIVLVLREIDRNCNIKSINILRTTIIYEHVKVLVVITIF